MRTICQVVGIGNRITGTKNGRDYDFIPVSIVFDDGYTVGQCAATVTVSPGDMKNITIGNSYDCVLHRFKGSYTLDAIIAESK